MRSRLATVDRRWATTMAVRPSMSRPKASCTAASLSESKALVASSSTRMGQSASIAGRGDTLALTADSLMPALTGDGVEPLGQILDELERVGRPGRLANLLYRGVGPPIGDVLGNGAVEQQRLLGT